MLRQVSLLVLLMSVTALAAPGMATIAAPRITPPPPLAGVGTTDGSTNPDPRYGLLTPIPGEGAVPPIVGMLNARSESELAWRARARQYERELRKLRHEFFRTRRADTRNRGIERLGEFSDPAAFRPMVEVLAAEDEDVQHALLRHLETSGDEGQAALAWVAIHHEDEPFRAEALMRLEAPASAATLRVLDQGLRSTKHRIANNAGVVSNVLNAAETIPLLIFAQATVDPRDEQTGDLAWFAVETQHTFVAGLQAVVGDNSGAYQPILGIVHDGTLLRVMDAVVVVYRTEIHTALVRMSSDLWGEPTQHLGYDMNAWWHWYNEEFVPAMNRRDP